MRLAYIAACKRILEHVDEAESQAREYTVPRGTLTMTAPIVFGRLHVVPVLNEFLARFVQINVQLTLSDHTIMTLLFGAHDIERSGPSASGRAGSRGSMPALTRG